MGSLGCDSARKSSTLRIIVIICLHVIINTIRRHRMMNTSFLLLLLSHVFLSKIDDMLSFISQEIQTICYCGNMF